MGNGPVPFVFFKVSTALASKAFAFFKAVQSTDSHIWPRTEQDICRYATEGALFGIRRSDSDEFVGLCYAMLNDQEAEFEIGGLIVASTVQGLGQA